MTSSRFSAIGTIIWTLLLKRTKSFSCKFNIRWTFWKIQFKSFLMRQLRKGIEAVVLIFAFSIWVVIEYRNVWNLSASIPKVVSIIYLDRSGKKLAMSNWLFLENGHIMSISRAIPLLATKLYRKKISSLYYRIVVVTIKAKVFYQHLKLSFFSLSLKIVWESTTSVLLLFFP